VLSGCQSLVGTGQHDRGEYLGFSQVLLAAGAGSVVASLWDVDDESTALLMERFYENLTGRFDGLRRGRSGPLPRAVALQEAQLWLRDFTDAAGRQPYRHPVYWAGFLLVGPPA
jgi:CHAT domain-containing protein